MKFLVCLLNAEVSEATQTLSSEIPITRGDPPHATTISSSLDLEITANPQVPSSLLTVFANASLSVMLESESNSRPTR